MNINTNEFGGVVTLLDNRRGGFEEGKQVFGLIVYKEDGCMVVWFTTCTNMVSRPRCKHADNFVRIQIGSLDRTLKKNTVKSIRAWHSKQGGRGKREMERERERGGCVIRLALCIHYKKNGMNR